MSDLMTAVQRTPVCHDTPEEAVAVIDLPNDTRCSPTDWNIKPATDAGDIDAIMAAERRRVAFTTYADDLRLAERREQKHQKRALRKADGSGPLFLTAPATQAASRRKRRVLESQARKRARKGKRS